MGHSAISKLDTNEVRSIYTKLHVMYSSKPARIDGICRKAFAGLRQIYTAEAACLLLNFYYYKGAAILPCK